MQSRRILLVDDEPNILAILKKSLQKLDPPCEILTARDGNEALTLLQDKPFNLVVTDYKMAGLDGIELLERIQQLQPETRTILITAYGSDELEVHARRLQAYEYLTKPLEIGAFRQVVQQALGDFAINQPGFLVLSDDRYRKIDALLAKLEQDIGAFGILLVNTSGQVILRRGHMDGLPVEEIVTLVSGGIATLSEAGQVFDQFEDAVNLAYREGQKYDLYGLNIGKSLLLIMFVSRSAYSSPLGSVWYYARRATDHLREMLGEDDYATTDQILNQDFEQALGNELDDLLGLESLDTPENPGIEMRNGQNSRTTSSALSDPPPSRSDFSPSIDPPNNSNHLLTLQDAIQYGLLPNDPMFSPGTVSGGHDANL